MKSITTLVLGALALMLVAVGVAYSGHYNVSALPKHSSFMTWVLSTTSRNSIERQARGISVPYLSDKELIFAGANDYQSMCVSCHGGPGIRPEPMGQGLNPPPADLAESAKQMTAAELFWTTKNGVRMTGMPAWGASHEDADIWPVVAFLTVLPGMESDEYQTMLKQAGGMGHHSTGGTQSHQATEHHSQAETSSASATPHSHSDNHHNEMESGADEAPHTEAHQHDPGTSQASPDSTSEPAEEPEAESHHEHKH